MIPQIHNQGSSTCGVVNYLNEKSTLRSVSPQHNVTTARSAEHVAVPGRRSTPNHKRHDDLRNRQQTSLLKEVPSHRVQLHRTPVPVSLNAMPVGRVRTGRGVRGRLCSPSSASVCRSVSASVGARRPCWACSRCCTEPQAARSGCCRPLTPILVLGLPGSATVRIRSLGAVLERCLAHREGQRTDNPHVMVTPTDEVRSGTGVHRLSATSSMPAATRPA